MSTASRLRAKRSQPRQLAIVLPKVVSMRVQPDRNHYVLSVLALITVVVGGGPLDAQTELLPAVDLRRNLPLSADVWPGDFNGDGVTDLVASTGPSPHATPTGLQVVLGNGDGTFGLPILTNYAGRAM